ncbi:MAG: sel1 repeat family protein [Clostridia bacterium]|nr:sel1 repeat family protein [Clostridia bacterium]
MTTAEKLYQEALALDKEGNAERALTLYLGAAELGYVPAQLNAGVAYLCGRGAAQDYKTAVFWLEKAAAQNNASAIANLAYCCSNGFGVARDEARALELYRTAANLGDSAASRQYALLQSRLSGAAPAAAPAPAAQASPAAPAAPVRRRRPAQPAPQSAAESPELDKIFGQIFSAENVPTVSTDVHLSGPQNATTVVTVYVPQFGRSAQVCIPNSIEPDKTVTISADLNAAMNGINSPLRVHVVNVTRAGAPAAQPAPQRTQTAAPVRQPAQQSAQAAPVRQPAQQRTQTAQTAAPAAMPADIKKKIRAFKFRIYLRPVLVLLCTIAFVLSMLALFALSALFPDKPIPPMLGNLIGVGFSGGFILVFFAWFFPWVLGRYPKPGFFKTRKIMRHLEKRRLLEKAVVEMETCQLTAFGDKMCLSDHFLFPKKKNGIIIPCDELLWLYAEYSRRRHYGHLMLGTKYWGVMGLSGARGGKKYSQIINASGHALQKRCPGILMTDTKENRKKYFELKKKYKQLGKQY